MHANRTINAQLFYENRATAKLCGARIITIIWCCDLDAISLFRNVCKLMDVSSAKAYSDQPFLSPAFSNCCYLFLHTLGRETSGKLCGGREQPLLTEYACNLNTLRNSPIGDLYNVLKYHAYSVNLDLATANVCKVDASNRNHIEHAERSCSWIKWLIIGL